MAPAARRGADPGGGRFENITPAAGVGVPAKVSVSASFGDIDNDGDPDLYVTTVRGGNMLFENDGKGRFKDVSRASGLGYVGHSSSAVFFDYDRDGKLDLFLVNVGRYTTNRTAGDGYKYYVGIDKAFEGHLTPALAEPSVLYHNEGGSRFVDVSRRLGLRDLSWSGDASAVDVNDDGWLDLYVLNMQGNDEYYENGDGKASIWGNTLFLKEGPGQFREVSDSFGSENYCPWGPSVGDLKADGYDDTFIASGMNYPYRYMINSVKLNDRGVKCADAEFVLGVEPHMGGIATPWFELDASGKDKAHADAAGATGPRHLGGAAAAARRSSSISTATAISTSSPTNTTPRRWSSSAT